MQINISAEDVERMVKDELVKAGLGKAIAEAVQKTLAPGYNNPLDTAVSKYVGEVASRLLRETFAETIEHSVAAAIKARITVEFIDKVVAEAVAKMVRAVDSY